MSSLACAVVATLSSPFSGPTKFGLSRQSPSYLLSGPNDGLSPISEKGPGTFFSEDQGQEPDGGEGFFVTEFCNELPSPPVVPDLGLQKKVIPDLFFLNGIETDDGQVKEKIDDLLGTPEVVGPIIGHSKVGSRQLGI